MKYNHKAIWAFYYAITELYETMAGDYLDDEERVAAAMPRWKAGFENIKKLAEEAFSEKGE